LNEKRKAFGREQQGLNYHLACSIEMLSQLKQGLNYHLACSIEMLSQFQTTQSPYSQLFVRFSSLSLDVSQGVCESFYVLYPAT